MHCRLYQVSTTPFTAEDEERFKTSEQYEDIRSFCGPIADYVIPTYDMDDDIRWLVSSAYGALEATEENGVPCLTVKDKTKYFHNKYIQFERATSNASELSEADFAGAKAELMAFSISETVKEKYGFYIDVDGELEPLDSVLRWAEPGTKYYVHSTFDYHF